MSFGIPAAPAAEGAKGVEAIEAEVTPQVSLADSRKFQRRVKGMLR